MDSLAIVQFAGWEGRRRGAGRKAHELEQAGSRGPWAGYIPVSGMHLPGQAASRSVGTLMA